MSSLLNTTFTAKIDKNILTFIKVKCLKILREYFCLPDCKQEPNKLMYGGISVVPRGIHAMPYHTIQGRIHDIQTCYTPLLPGSIITGTRHQWNNFMSTALKICSLWISTSHLFILRRTVCHRCFCSGAPRFSVFISRWHAKGLGLLWSVALRINCLLSISAPDMSLQLTTPDQTKP